MLSFIFGDTRVGASQVRFIGFNNMEEKEMEELFLSKGEERRKEQESRGEGGIRFFFTSALLFFLFTVKGSAV